MKISVENGKTTIDTPTGRMVWEPTGEPQGFGTNPIKVGVYGVPTSSARMFVGFNVGRTPTHDVDKLAVLYRRERTKQRNDAGEKIPAEASFVIQKGLYQSPVDGMIYEDSSQLIVLSLYGESPKKFTSNMKQIAGAIARDFQQEVVILEIQEKGVPKEVFGVSWQA